MKNLGTQKIETNRLILRRFKWTDRLDVYNNWASDPEVTRMLYWPTNMSAKATEMIIKRWIRGYFKTDFYRWAIESKEISQVIGSISLTNVDYCNESCEIGYCISKKFWNQGMASEAFNAIIQFAFNEMHINRIVGRHDIGNIASGRVMEKCGLIYEGTLRQSIRDPNGDLADCKYYSILRNDFIKL